MALNGIIKWITLLIFCSSCIDIFRLTDILRQFSDFDLRQFSYLRQLYVNFTSIIRQFYVNFQTLTYVNFRTFGNYTAILRQFYVNFRTLNFQIWFRSNSDLIQIWSASLGSWPTVFVFVMGPTFSHLEFEQTLQIHSLWYNSASLLLRNVNPMQGNCIGVVFHVLLRL